MHGLIAMFVLSYYFCCVRSGNKPEEISVRKMLQDEFGEQAIGKPRDREKMSRGEELQNELFGNTDYSKFYREEPNVQQGTAMAAVWLRFEKTEEQQKKKFEENTSKAELFIVQNSPRDPAWIIGWMTGVQPGKYGLTVTQWAQMEMNEYGMELCDTSGPEHLVNGEKIRIDLSDTLFCKFHDEAQKHICVVNATSESAQLWGGESIVGRMMKFVLINEEEHTGNRTELYLPQNHTEVDQWSNTTTKACGVVGIANDFVVMYTDDLVNVDRDNSQMLVSSISIVFCCLILLFTIC